MKLQWEKNPTEKPMNYKQAVEYAKSLGEGWRLPTKEELDVISKMNSKETKKIGFQELSYWSTDSKNSYWGWIFNFDMGSIYKLSLKERGHYEFNVLCVKEVKQ